METRETSGSSFVKAEREDRTSAKNANNGTSDSEEVSPSATDESANPLLSSKCVFCKKTTLQFDEVKLLQCLHSVCTDCMNSQSAPYVNGISEL